RHALSPTVEARQACAFPGASGGEGRGEGEGSIKKRPPPHPCSEPLTPSLSPATSKREDALFHSDRGGEGVTRSRSSLNMTQRPRPMLPSCSPFLAELPFTSTPCSVPPTCRTRFLPAFPPCTENLMLPRCLWCLALLAGGFALAAPVPSSQFTPRE